MKQCGFKGHDFGSIKTSPQKVNRAEISMEQPHFCVGYISKVFTECILFRGGKKNFCLDVICLQTEIQGFRSFDEVKKK